MVADLLVEDGLGQRGIVGLVVTVAAIADEVDHDIGAEGLAVADRQPGGDDGRLGVVGVDMEHRRRHGAGGIRRVARHQVLRRRRREADLVVDDDVDRAAGRESVQRPQRQRLEHGALPDEGRVAVQQHRRHAPALGVAAVSLLGAHDALDDRVDRLEMAGVRRERDVDRAAVGRAMVVGEPEVVLHVAVAVDVGRQQRALELGEDQLVGLLEDVGQHVEAAAVRHAEHQLGDLQPRGLVDQRRQQRDQRVAALQREALLARIAHLQELLERLGGDEPLQDLPAIVGVERRPPSLPALAEPVAPGLVGEARVLDGQRGAVGRAQRGHEVAQGAGGAGRERRPVDDAVEILLADAALLQPQQRMLARAATERVEVGGEVSQLAKGLDERDGGAGWARRRPRRVVTGLAAGGEPVRETGEDQRPALVDGARIAPVVLPERKNVRGIGPRQLIEPPWAHSSPGPGPAAPA